MPDFVYWRMKASLLGGTLASLLFLVMVIFTAPGCSSFGAGGSPTARLVEQYAVYKGVQAYIKKDAAKAERVVRVIDDLLPRLEGDLAQASVSLIASALRSSIEWDQLDPIDALMLNSIIDQVQAELLARIDTGEIPADALVAVRTVLTWARESALMVAAPTA